MRVCAMVTALMLAASVLVFARTSALLDDATETSWHRTALAAAVAFEQENRIATCEAGTAQSAPPRAFELPVGNDSAAPLALLVRLSCRKMGQSQSSVFLLSDQVGAVSRVWFPAPVLSSDMTVSAITPRQELISAYYDEDARTLTAVERWPEYGTSYTKTLWAFRDDRFEIISFSVDATVDGIDNPLPLIENEPR